MKQSTLNDARRIIEGWRYQHSTEAALNTFIAYWASSLSNGIYPCSDPLTKDSEFQSDAAALTKIIGTLVVECGEVDVLGQLLCEFTGAAKQYDFYPTPPEIVSLMNALLSGHTEECSDPATSPTLSIYEPCCGTLGIAYDQLEKICQKHHQAFNPLNNVCVTLEDINPIACHAALIQMVLYIHRLQRVYGSHVRPQRITIEQKNVLSQESRGLLYIIEQKPAAELKLVS